ncbi:unnamed protein product [Effrenium voratum]|uniref:FHA domain-containing protein n=2 Tax=Effrenium voratum TaxID=2562239 RepID=A0AA36JB44_9DINO|nr:unnamed protein product [Effrenium voratum]CAJ1402434.1 unnamed protein product [Effrenium voratum]CAJ1430549.1 unnamed protein product [Effrenium voratum]
MTGRTMASKGESKEKRKDKKESSRAKKHGDKSDKQKSKREHSKVEKEAKERRESGTKRKAEEAKDKRKKGKEKKQPTQEDQDDRRRSQGGAADVKNGNREKPGKEERTTVRSAPESNDKSSKRERRRQGPCAAEPLDTELGAQKGGSSGSRASPARIELKPSPVPEPKAMVSASSESETSGIKRRKRRENAGLKAATGFGLAPPPPAPDAGFGLSGLPMYGPSSLMPLPDKVKGLLEHKDTLAQEVLRMKMAVEAATGVPGMKLDSKEDPAETTLKMPTRLTDCLMDPDNHAKLLSKTGLLSVMQNEEKHLVLRAPSRRQLQKTLGSLRRIAWACQWGCSSPKVGALLADKPAKAVNSMVLRLAATSSRLSSHDAKLSAKMRKLRLGTQAGPGMLVLEGIPGLSRKHCTITFEPEKGACYVQDVSTNGTYLNGKRLPRPPFKNPSDARVRLFHGDELLFKLRTDDAEELGYVINLVELN